jgi:hypothetical protein
MDYSIFTRSYDEHAIEVVLTLLVQVPPPGNLTERFGYKYIANYIGSQSYDDLDQIINGVLNSPDSLYSKLIPLSGIRPSRGIAGDFILISADTDSASGRDIGTGNPFQAAFASPSASIASLGSGQAVITSATGEQLSGTSLLTNIGLTPWTAGLVKPCVWDFKSGKLMGLPDPAPPAPILGMTVSDNSGSFGLVRTIYVTTTSLAEITVTLSDGGYGGVFNPAVANIGGMYGTAVNVDYFPPFNAKSGDAITFTATNNGGLANPPPINYSFLPAVLLSSQYPDGPAGFPVNMGFTLILNGGVFTETLSVSLSLSTGDGTISPPSALISESTPSVTFIFTPTSPGYNLILPVGFNQSIYLIAPQQITYNAY